MSNENEKFPGWWFRLALVVGCCLGIVAPVWPPSPASAGDPGPSAAHSKAKDSLAAAKRGAKRLPLPEIDQAAHDTTRIALFAYG